MKEGRKEKERLLKRNGDKNTRRKKDDGAKVEIKIVEVEEQAVKLWRIGLQNEMIEVACWEVEEFDTVM